MVARQCDAALKVEEAGTEVLQVRACQTGATLDFAAVFTKNAFPGAPVIVGRQRLNEPRLGAIVVNNKISNV
ncbi:MAG TPA: hypothetical protein PK867_22135, partial [Pirellulales bacterium]|nr:hypothetical protein [Pirellulales bacterium]